MGRDGVPEMLPRAPWYWTLAGNEEQWEDRDHSREGALQRRTRRNSAFLMPDLEGN